MGEHTSLFAVDEANRQRAREHLDAKERRAARLVGAALVVLAIWAVAATVVAALVIQNQQGSREAASRRISMLQEEIKRLGDEVADGNRKVGELTSQVEVLSQQVRDLGGTPIVVQPSASSSSSTSQQPTTTTAPRSPSPTTTTTTPQERRCVVVVCVG
jgi:hydroxymethylpyrimidine/phosphomethylpyrimidine kinase